MGISDFNLQKIGCVINDLAFARELGVDFVQGFHFRDKFKIIKKASN
jgi:hypothetical protein